MLKPINKGWTGTRVFLQGTLVLVLACGLVGAHGTAWSTEAEATSTTDNGGELQALLDLLDEQTELATRSRLNADYVPGMMTVLSGDEMLARGARTVWEALALVPGLSQGIEPTGERQVLTRGFGHGYASGNLKILLDDVSMNSGLLATANPVMNIPIEQVERIEVMRGPGSSVYGEYAYAGVINVITRRGQKSVYGLAGSGETYGGGGLWNWQDEARDISVSLNLAGIKGDGPDADVDQDGLYESGLDELSNAPGSTNEAHQYSAVFFDLSWGDYFASVKVMDDAYGDHFGINHYLPPQDHHLASWQRERSFVVGRNLVFSDTLDARVRFEYLRHDRERDRLYVEPEGLYEPYWPGPVFMNLDYEETRLLGQAEFHWRPNPRHEVLFVVEGSQTEVEDSTWDWSGLGEFPISDTWLNPARNRTNFNMVLQDQFKVADDVTLTATLRYDHYDNLDDSLSPRLAAVWRIDQQNILKFQYARAFRPPTFYELQYWGWDDSSGEWVRPVAESAKIDTYEIGYVLKRPQWEGRITAYYSELDGPISYIDSYEGYMNDLDARLQGFEVEYQQRLGRHFKLDANLSYVDAERKSTGEPLPGGTDWLANAALLWQPDQRWSSALQMRYVGERAREDRDYRGPLDAYTVLDLTIGYRSPSNGFKAWTGIKNLTDEDVRFPNQDTADEQGDYLPYPDDYPRPGRTWWLSVGYDF